MDEVQEQLDYWKKVVAEHEDQGLKVWGPEDFSVGQRILAHGRPAVIVKVNPKTLRVKFDLEWMNALNITKVPYDALSQKKTDPKANDELNAFASRPGGSAIPVRRGTVQSCLNR
jgi:tRNA U54 and U55 pseudouridine synthase Pus10